MFYLFFNLFFSPGVLRGSLTDRRETLPHDCKMGALYNTSPKFREALTNKLGLKHAKFWAIYYNFRL